MVVFVEYVCRLRFVGDKATGRLQPTFGRFISFYVSYQNHQNCMIAGSFKRKCDLQIVMMFCAIFDQDWKHTTYS